MTSDTRYWLLIAFVAFVVLLFFGGVVWALSGSEAEPTEALAFVDTEGDEWGQEFWFKVVFKDGRKIGCFDAWKEGRGWWCDPSMEEGETWYPDDKIEKVKRL